MFVVNSGDGVSIEHAVEEGVGVFRELYEDGDHSNAMRALCCLAVVGIQILVIMNQMDLSRKALSIEEVLRTLSVFAPKVEADLLQPVAVTQRTPRDVHQVGFVRPQGHMLPRVVHGASHLASSRVEPERGQVGVEDHVTGFDVDGGLPLPNGAQVPGRVHQTPEGWDWNEAPLDDVLIRPPTLIKLGCNRLS